MADPNEFVFVKAHIRKKSNKKRSKYLINIIAFIVFVVILIIMLRGIN